MQAIIPGRANTILFDLDNKTDGAPLTEGTVTFYLVALDGPHVLQWWKADDETWSDTEAVAGAGSYKGGCTWLCTVAAAAWSYGVRYFVYAKDDGGLACLYSDMIVPLLVVGAVGSGGIKWTYTLTDSVTGLPIADATVWVTTDAAGTNVVYQTTTDPAGVATFYLAAGTYYIWRRRTGYAFTNPDTEVVS